MGSLNYTVCTKSLDGFWRKKIKIESLTRTLQYKEKFGRRCGGREFQNSLPAKFVFEINRGGGGSEATVVVQRELFNEER
jgi:hypothetical protein